MSDEDANCKAKGKKFSINPSISIGSIIEVFAIFIAAVFMVATFRMEMAQTKKQVEVQGIRLEKLAETQNEIARTQMRLSTIIEEIYTRRFKNLERAP